MGPSSELGARHTLHTSRPRDSPNNILLHIAQLLGTEGAEVGRMKAGQQVQGDLVQLAPSRHIAGNQGSHLREDPSERPGAGRDLAAQACTAHPSAPSQQVVT